MRWHYTLQYRMDLRTHASARDSDSHQRTRVDGSAERKAATARQAESLEAQRRAALLLSDRAWDEERASSPQVARWSAGQVVEWFEGTFRWADRYVEHLQLAGIDGESLLAMDDAGLRHDLKVRTRPRLLSVSRS